MGPAKEMEKRWGEEDSQKRIMELKEGIGFKREKLVNSDMLQRVQKGQKIGLGN